MIDWAQAFVALFVSHQVGDYLLQTDWQAHHKRGGLGSDPVARRALLTHIATYTLAFVPALIWLATELGVAAAVLLAALIAIPHMIEDDGRLLVRFIRRVKHSQVAPGEPLFALVDQSFHIVALFLAALIASALG